MNKGLANSKLSNFNDWYREIITKGELIDYYDVKGCYVLLPNAYNIWDSIKNFLDREFKMRGVENYYFPLFVTKENLQKEEKHLEGFKAEVAWIKNENKVSKNENKVSRDENKNYIDENKDCADENKDCADENKDCADENKVSGDRNNDCIIAVRPTSECIICPVMSNRIRSHEDLPKKVNQWANVVRNEFKDTIPFIRSREFLWQEGHTFYSSKEDAQNEVYDIINLYKNVYENLLAVPVILGKKTKAETFAGAEYTYTIEGLIPEVNKGIQCATSHHLGKGFTTMFDIKYTNNKMENEYCYYNSWGFTTRSIGVMIQTHSDDKGLIFPPNVTPIHIVIIPIYTKKNKDKVCEYSKLLQKKLSGKYITKIDLSENTPGYKYNYWELRGVPLRMEIGEKEIDNNTYTVVRRDTSEKIKIEVLDEISTILKNIQTNLYQTALNKITNKIKYTNKKDDIDNLSNENIILINFCGSEDCEREIKDKYNIKSLCIPEDDKITITNTNNKCVICDIECNNLCIFGKSY